MGTNYYHEAKPLSGLRCQQCREPLYCNHCEPDHGRVHIGKSSAGWKFLFQPTPDARTWDAWIRRLASGGRIVDEYGKPQTLAWFVDLVTGKQRDNAMRHHKPTDYDSRLFIDADGFAFNDCDFT